MKDKELLDELEGVVQRIQRDSNEEKVGMSNLVMLREDRWMSARPPPLPVSLGALMMEKFGGQRQRSDDG
jgi:hypothetical protein